MTIDLNPPQECSVTVLATGGNRPEFRARILSARNRQMTLSSDVPLEDGSSVQLSWDRYLILAEVTSRRSEDAFVLYIRHALNLDEVDLIREKWL